MAFAQAMQTEPQADEQQTPSTQEREPHWALVVHAAPTGNVTAAPTSGGAPLSLPGLPASTPASGRCASGAASGEGGVASAGLACGRASGAGPPGGCPSGA